jgi:hypothetical protein
MIAVLILVVWAGMLAWLGLRELAEPSGFELSDAVRNVPPGANYYSVTMGGAQIGYAINTVDTVPEGLTVEDRLVLEVPALGEMQRTEARTVANLTNSLRLKDFEAGLAGEAGRFTARGQVSGDTLLSVELTSGGSNQTISVPLDEPIVLPAYVPLRIAFGGGLEVGRTSTIRMFDPLLLQNRDVAVEVLAESTLVVPDSAAYDSTLMRWIPARWDTLHAWQVRQTTQGVSLEAWIDDMGQIVSATTGMGFAFERSAFEIVFYNFERRDRSQIAEALRNSDVIRQTAVASNVDLSRQTVREMRVRLLNVDLAGFDLIGGRQSLIGDTLRIRQERAEAIQAQYRLPADSIEFAEYLAAEPLIQSTDPRIQAQARQIVGRRRDPRRAAELLNEWVYEALDKQITISVPSAVDVLESGRGDCNEHTVLYVALARAAGLPARTAAGLAYANGSFFYHAWPEVYLGDWVAVDPTFGQFPADAAHLRFTIGGLARQVELIRLIGRLELDVLEVEE